MRVLSSVPDRITDQPLRRSLENVREAHAPLVEHGANFPAFIGAAALLRDKLQPDVANPVFVGIPENRNGQLLEPYVDKQVRTDESIEGIMRAGKTGFSSDPHNPEALAFWGARPATGITASQLFFSNEMTLPSDKVVRELFNTHAKPIELAMRDVVHASNRLGSLGYTLELDQPQTPNAFVIYVDLMRSTQGARYKYPAQRAYLNALHEKVAALSELYQAKITDITGDGYYVVSYLPEGIDKNNPRELGTFGATTVVPLTDGIMTAHTDLRSQYEDLAPNIHLGIGLGSVETLPSGAVTGRVHWALNGGAERREPDEMTDEGDHYFILPFARSSLDRARKKS